jgi:hypothetical protein
VHVDVPGGPSMTSRSQSSIGLPLPISRIPGAAAARRPPPGLGTYSAAVRRRHVMARPSTRCWSFGVPSATPAGPVAIAAAAVLHHASASSRCGIHVEPSTGSTAATAQARSRRCRSGPLFAAWAASAASGRWSPQDGTAASTSHETGWRFLGDEAVSTQRLQVLVTAEDPPVDGADGLARSARRYVHRRSSRLPACYLQAQAKQEGLTWCERRASIDSERR